MVSTIIFFFFFSSRRRHTRWNCDWSSDVCSSDLETSRIKLGSAVVVVPLYQPVRLLSEIGMVDALTHGRLVLGVGSGYQPYEFERFGEALKDSVSKLTEFTEMLELAFTRDTFSYDGKHFKLPETHIA